MTSPLEDAARSLNAAGHLDPRFNSVRLNEGTGSVTVYRKTSPDGDAGGPEISRLYDHALGSRETEEIQVVFAAALLSEAEVAGLVELLDQHRARLAIEGTIIHAVAQPTPNSPVEILFTGRVPAQSMVAQFEVFGGGTVQFVRGEVGGADLFLPAPPS